MQAEIDELLRRTKEERVQSSQNHHKRYDLPENEQQHMTPMYGYNQDYDERTFGYRFQDYGPQMTGHSEFQK